MEEKLQAESADLARIEQAKEFQELAQIGWASLNGQQRNRYTELKALLSGDLFGADEEGGNAADAKTTKTAIIKENCKCSGHVFQKGDHVSIEHEVYQTLKSDNLI